MREDWMIKWDGFSDIANNDGEFKVAARFWSGSLRLDFDDYSIRASIENGALKPFEQTSRDSAATVTISAPNGDWEKLLVPTPRPFFQDVIVAQIHHGFEIGPSPMAYAAYYPAIRRLIDLVRRERNSKGHV